MKNKSKNVVVLMISTLILSCGPSQVSNQNVKIDLEKSQPSTNVQIVNNIIAPTPNQTVNQTPLQTNNPSTIPTVFPSATLISSPSINSTPIPISTVTINPTTITTVNPTPTTVITASPTPTAVSTSTPTLTPIPITTPITYSVSTIAGGTSGFIDGNGTNAQFKAPARIALDSNGNIYVADAYNHAIRKVTPSGTVTTIAGNGSPGTSDGNGASAQFNTPSNVAVDKNGNIYVGDNYGQKVRKITPSGTVTTLAGNGTSGFAEGMGTSVMFANPIGIEVDNNGYVYVADFNNHRIRKISPSGVVTTIAGTGTAGYADGASNISQFNQPVDLSLDSNGNLYISDMGNQMIRKLTTDGTVSTIKTGIKAESIEVDNQGNIYFLDTYNQYIKKITMANDIVNVAGSGIKGFQDGAVENARFSNPFGIAISQNGDIYIGDLDNNRIRKISKN